MKILSRDCDGCYRMRGCAVRFMLVRHGEFVYCEDGTRHLVDSEPSKETKPT